MLQTFTQCLDAMVLGAGGSWVPGVGPSTQQGLRSAGFFPTSQSHRQDRETQPSGWSCDEHECLTKSELTEERKDSQSRQAVGAEPRRMKRVLRVRKEGRVLQVKKSLSKPTAPGNVLKVA